MSNHAPCVPATALFLWVAARALRRSELSTVLLRVALLDLEHRAQEAAQRHARGGEREGQAAAAAITAATAAAIDTWVAHAAV